MDLFGEFQKVEIDGKPCLVYHNVMKPLPQIHSPNLSDEKTIIKNPFLIENKTNSDLPLPPLFVCPMSRLKSTVRTDNITILDEDEVPVPELFFKLKTSPLVGDIGHNHHVLPLFWCNNKEDDSENDCYACGVPKVDTDYYFCVKCDSKHHKKCVESPLEINYPSHVKHSLQLYFSTKSSNYCILCRKTANNMLYYCALCDISMHVLCAQATIPFFIHQPKRHDHILRLFPRQASLTCNVCGLVNKLHLTYVCRSICDFVAHSDCIDIPQTIRISRHHHHISFTSSLPLVKWSCGVCRQEVDSDYGAYICNACSGYTVHTRCALRKDIWDGKELEGVPKEHQDVEPPFKRIAGGMILHFSHGCNLKFETSGAHDENKFCEACTLPINKENFYECVECDFILHETCADAPCTKVHPTHPHLLEQKIVHEDYVFSCSACRRISNGFGYGCTSQDCNYILDVVCASTSEPFTYQGHQHSLFLSLDPEEVTMCHICKSTGVQKVFNCIECDCNFIICFKCATLPYMVKYNHDEHYLTFCHGDEASDSDWCEVCEGKLAIGGKEGFYKCNDCCTTLHISCLLGPDPYLKPGQICPIFDEGETIIQRNNSLSRKTCVLCNIRCPYPVALLCKVKMFSYFVCTFTHP